MAPRYPIEYVRERASIRRFFPHASEDAVAEAARLLHDGVTANVHAPDSETLARQIALLMLADQRTTEEGGREHDVDARS